MGLAALVLLDHRVNVAEPAREWVTLEDRCGTRSMIGGVHHLACLMNSPGRGEPDRRVVIRRKPPRLPDFPPDFVERAQQKGASATKPRFGLRDLRLDHIVVAQGAFGTARDLVAGELDKSVERAPRDAESHSGEARSIDVTSAEGVEQAWFPGLRGVLARHRVLLGDK